MILNNLTQISGKQKLHGSVTNINCFTIYSVYSDPHQIQNGNLESEWSESESEWSEDFVLNRTRIRDIRNPN